MDYNPKGGRKAAMSENKFYSISHKPLMERKNKKLNIVSLFVSLFGFGVVGSFIAFIVANIAFPVAIILIYWWVFNHALAPSFGWPTINIH